MKTQKEWISVGYIPITEMPEKAKIERLTASKECLEMRQDDLASCVRDCTKCEWCMVKVLEAENEN